MLGETNESFLWELPLDDQDHNIINSSVVRINGKYKIHHMSHDVITHPVVSTVSRCDTTGGMVELWRCLCAHVAQPTAS